MVAALSASAALPFVSACVPAARDASAEPVPAAPPAPPLPVGPTEADAINSLKDAISGLYGELVSVPDQQLGKLPRRWKRALCTVAHPVAS